MKVKRRSLIMGIMIILMMLLGIFIQSEFSCRISVLFILILCIIRGKQEKYYLNPYYLFAITPFSLLIYRNISNYHVDLTIETWILAIINMAAFLLALEFTSEYRKLRKCIGAGDGKILRYNTIILLILGFMPFAYELLIGGLMPLAYVFSLFTSAAIICAMKSKDKGLIILVIGVCVLTSLEYVTKTTILTYTVAALIGYEKYYITNIKQKKRLIILVIIAGLVMVSAFSFANQGRSSLRSASEVAEYYTTYGNLQWEGNNSLLMPYMYLTTPWSNLQYVLYSQDARTFGLWLFKPILGYLQIDKVFEGLYALKAYSNFNTFTFIVCNFKDFGYWGSCISSFFLGFFAKKVYSRFRQSRSPLDVACYVLTGQAVLQMFFNNEFFIQSFLFTIVIIMGMYKYLFCKKCKIELESKLQ